ncbi:MULTISPECIES: HAMP domain-containing sensor histidine kinase [Rhodomicrobium]|uniref:sensor histidine kinase n=1 Tax=Rhodomicrobium TaxID=1068 RepID=UPI0014828A11|nr:MULTISPECIES: HAMP domain-containing sensor histidine kinase [Rhodomicrobium]
MTRFTLRASEWPIAIKVPLLVMLLMLAISFVITNTVLTRLAQTQERHLQTLSRAYLDGLGGTLLPHILREDVWEVFDTLDRARSVYAGLNAVTTIVLNPAKRVIAASDPKAFPTGQAVTPDLLAGLGVDGRLLIDEDKGTARMLDAVRLQGQAVGSVYTELDVSALMAERRSVLWQLIATNALLTLFLMAAGTWAVRRMLRPVRTLGSVLDRGSDGPVEIIPDAQLGSATSEFGRLFRRYNAMARAANERLHLAESLAEKERLASLGRLASGMAHEINNPLGGLFNALDAVKRYGDRESVRESSVRLLERGLNGIRDVVRATLMTYRQPDEPRSLKRDDIEDLQYLVQPALRQKDLTIDWRNDLGSDLPLPAAAVRDTVLNLLLNACAVSPEGGLVSLTADADAHSFEISVGDCGPGMPDAYRAFLENGSAASGPMKSGAGLGLWMVRRLLDASGGSANIEAGPAGTTIRLTLPFEREASRHVA